MTIRTQLAAAALGGIVASGASAQDVNTRVEDAVLAVAQAMTAEQLATERDKLGEAVSRYLEGTLAIEAAADRAKASFAAAIAEASANGEDLPEIPSEIKVGNSPIGIYSVTISDINIPPAAFE